MPYLSTVTFQWQYFLRISARTSAHLLSLCWYSLAVVFSAVPQGLRLLEGRFAWTAAQVTGNCRRCLGRSEQTSPLQAFLEQDLVIWVIGRVSEWLTPWEPSFHLQLCPSFLGRLWVCFALCYSYLAKKQHGRFVSGALSAQTSISQQFFTLLMCFEKREMKKDYKVHPQPAAAHCSAASSRFVLYLKIRITKVNTVVSRKPATMSSLLDQNKEPFTASGFFPELQQPVLMCRAWLHKQPAELEKD